MKQSQMRMVSLKQMYISLSPYVLYKTDSLLKKTFYLSLYKRISNRHLVFNNFSGKIIIVVIMSFNKYDTANILINEYILFLIMVMRDI